MIPNTENSIGKRELVSEMIKKPGRAYANIADDIERASFNNNIRKIYQKRNILIDKASRRASQISDFKGIIIKDEAARLQSGLNILRNCSTQTSLNSFMIFPSLQYPKN